jgi:hypothetical protein
MIEISPDEPSNANGTESGGFDPRSDVAERLRDAVRGAGGVRLVAALSGVKGRTLTRYLSGSQMKHGAASALAQVTGVRLEWLLNGTGPRQATPGLSDTARAEGASSGALTRTMSAISADARGQEAAVPGARSIWNLVDFDALVMCLELQEGLDRLGGGDIKSVRSRLRRAFNAYDIKKNDPE